MLDLDQARQWFVTREALPRVWMLNEPLHVCSWLVAGSERAVLLDSGMGIAPIGALARSLAGVPVQLLNTHYHFDHVGGNHEFAERAIHQAGLAPLAAGVPAEILCGYAAFVAARDPQLATYLDIDRSWLGLTTVDTVAQPLPEGVALEDWTIAPSTATGTVKEGDRIELGARTLTVMHTPGHSPDGISLLDEREGILFAGDQFNLGVTFAHFPDSDVEALARTARRLAELANNAVRLICSHHYPRVLGEPSLLGEYADAVELLAAGEAELHDATDIVGNAVRIAVFDRFGITVEVPGAPAAPLHNPLP
jgi:glyoxylase-like metal-dependent hydrolase (beta-lactamase superfamily II)